MKHYLTDLIGHPDFERPAALKPAGICPYLFYNLTPYIFTLATGGWFNWVVRGRDPSRRRPPVSGKIFKKNVNRRYPNEVLVGCPNPGAKTVAGVGPWQQDQICLRVIHSDDNCGHRHQVGRKICLDRKSAGDRALEFNRLFPEYLLRVMAGVSLETAVNRFGNGQAVTVSTADMIHPCRYHQRPGPEPVELLPDNACAHVFARIYPRVLARMYNASPALPITLSHPGRNGQLALTIEKTGLKKNPVQRWSDALMDHFCRFIRYPRDRIDYTLAVKVLRQETPDCSLSEGRRYPVNLDSGRFLCPAAFHTVYPYLLLNAVGVPMRWSPAEPETMVACPDCVGAVYRIKNHPARGN